MGFNLWDELGDIFAGWGSGGEDPPVDTATPEEWYPPYAGSTAADIGWGWPFQPGQEYRLYEQRLPRLPGWGEAGAWDVGNYLQSLIGLSPTNPLEQRAQGGAMSFLEEMQGAPPGGTAFAGIGEAMEPYQIRQEERGRSALEESLAHAGMLRSGAGQQVLADFGAQSGEAWANALAPFAMQGEALGQQGTLAGLGMLGGMGAQQYQRLYDPIQNYMQLLGSVGGTPMPRQQGGGDLWDALLGLGTGYLAGGGWG